MNSDFCGGGWTMEKGLCALLKSRLLRCAVDSAKHGSSQYGVHIAVVCGVYSACVCRVSFALACLGLVLETALYAHPCHLVLSSKPSISVTISALLW